MDWRAILRPGMRAYFVPMAAGAVLASSVFMPWVTVGDISLSGFPDGAALWIMGLGASAVVLSVLSLITRKNSRHPLLLVGLIALAILVLSWRIMPRQVERRALTRSQAVAIVEDVPLGSGAEAFAGSGLYVGLAASGVLTAFGLTIVIKRASAAYVVDDPNDDV